MKLSKRLLAISDFVDDNSKIIDVGCDHALLDIYLHKFKRNVKIVASDINEGPCKQAKENCKKYDVDIKVKLGNGLDTIEDDIDTIIISGMGGDNIIEILTRNKRVLDNINTIILSPQSEFYKVRKIVTKLGFYIQDEKLVEDGKKVYTIIKFVKGSKKYNYKDFYFGPIIRYNKELEFFKYYKKLLKKEQEIYRKIPKKNILKRFKVHMKIKNLLKELQ